MWCMAHAKDPNGQHVKCGIWEFLLAINTVGPGYIYDSRYGYSSNLWEFAILIILSQRLNVAFITSSSLSLICSQKYQESTQRDHKKQWSETVT